MTFLHIEKAGVDILVADKWQALRVMDKIKADFPTLEISVLEDDIPPMLKRDLVQERATIP